MSTIVEYTLPITYDNIKTYWTAQNSSVDLQTYDGWGYEIMIGTKSTSYLYAEMKLAGKNILYPTATAKPFKCSFGSSVSKAIGAFRCNGSLNIDDTPIATAEISGYNPGSSSCVLTDYTHSAISASTRSSTIRLYLKSTDSSCYARWSDFDSSIINAIKMYFYKCSFSATAGEGVESATVTSTAYSGDTVTFSCNLKPGYYFKGWYNGSSLISTDKTLSFSCGSDDFSLQAVATDVEPKPAIIKYASFKHKDFVEGKRLDYIQSTGSQYIDTGVKFSEFNKLELDYQFTNSTTAQGSIFCIDAGDASRGYALLETINGGIRYGCGNGYNGLVMDSFNTNRHTAVITIGKSVVVDGVTKCNGDSSYSTDEHLYLLAGNDGGDVPNYYSYSILYGCKVYNDTTLIRHFIPFQVGDYNGLLDVVNNVFYTSANSNTIAGGEVISGSGVSITESYVLCNELIEV